MATPTLDNNGLVHCPPEFFDHWIVDHTLSRGMDRFSDPSHTPMQWRLYTNGAALASDVVAADFDWERVSSCLARCAREQNLADEVIESSLAEAWNWGLRHPTKWMKLPRSWIWVIDREDLLNLEDGQHVCVEEFDRRRQHLCPLPGYSMSDFLIEHEQIHRVESVRRDEHLARRFTVEGEKLVLNIPPISASRH